MRVQVRKWGNSAAVRLPASVLEAASMTIDQDVEVREEDGRIVIEPASKPAYDLNVLLAAMTPETFPEDVDFGDPVGKEVW